MDIGNRLKNAREAQGLSLEAIEEETKIRRKYLKALEDEQFDVLPGPVYAKAFLKNYARYLKLDVEDVLPEFNRKVKAYASIEDDEKESKEAVREEDRPAKTHSRWYVAVVAVILLGVSLYYAATGAGLGRTGDQARENPNKTDQITNNDQKPDVRPNGQQPADPAPAPVEQGVNVTLNVKGNQSWILVVVDGNPAFQGLLTSGQSRDFMGNNKIYVRLGNAGAVEVLVNGQNLGYLGGQGDVVDKEFPALPRG